MSEYIPRLTPPGYDDLRWIQIDYGGYNQCIVGSSGPPSVLPNCTGYVHGRCMELAGVNTDNLGLSFGDAVTYWDQSSGNWSRDTEPSLGAVVVYESLPAYAIEAPHPGHVAIVEQIIDADTVVISQSDYGGQRFRTYTIKREWGWTPFPNPSDFWVRFIGFLGNPYVDPTPGPTPDPGSNDPKYAILFLAKKRKEAKNVIQRITGVI